MQGLKRPNVSSVTAPSVFRRRLSFFVHDSVVHTWITLLLYCVVDLQVSRAEEISECFRVRSKM